MHVRSQGKVVCDMDIDWLTRFLIRGICGMPLEITVDNVDNGPEPFPSSVSLSALDGARLSHPTDELYLCISDGLGDGGNTSVATLIAAIRDSGLPLIYDLEWLAWDRKEECLRYGFVVPKGFRHSTTKPRTRSASDETILTRFLTRMSLSTDHGKKPLLLAEGLLVQAIEGQEIEFGVPHTIRNEDVAKHFLIYYDKFGKPATIPLEKVARLGYAIVTRTTAYVAKNWGLVPMLNDAQLYASAFMRAQGHFTTEAEWFLAKKKAEQFFNRLLTESPPRKSITSRFGISNITVTNPYIELSSSLIQRTKSEMCILRTDILLKQTS